MWFLQRWEMFNAKNRQRNRTANRRHEIVSLFSFFSFSLSILFLSHRLFSFFHYSMAQLERYLIFVKEIRRRREKTKRLCRIISRSTWALFIIYRKKGKRDKKRKGKEFKASTRIGNERLTDRYIETYI